MSRSQAAQLYEKHIRSLPAEERRELVALIERDLSADDTDSDSKPRHSLMELHGLGKEIWEGIDAQEYVDKLRGPWPDHEP
jgi:hypothetical protein